MRNWLFFLMFSFVFLSCKKEYHVVGRVYNPITGEGYANVKVEFSRFTIGELPGGFTEVASTSSDADGFYELKYKGIAERVQPEPYNLYLLGTMEEGKYQQVTILDHTKIQWVDWHIVPYGEIKVNIHNISCEGGTDQLKLERIYQYDTPNNSVYQPIYLMGCYSQDGVAAKVPMGTYEIKWTVTKTSTGTNTFTGSVFVPENGVGEFTINY